MGGSRGLRTCLRLGWIRCRVRGAAISTNKHERGVQVIVQGLSRIRTLSIEAIPLVSYDDKKNVLNIL